MVFTRRRRRLGPADLHAIESFADVLRGDPDTSASEAAFRLRFALKDAAWRLEWRVAPRRTMARVYSRVHELEDDLRLLSVALARSVVDTGQRHTLEQVADEFGVDLDADDDV